MREQLFDAVQEIFSTMIMMEVAAGDEAPSGKIQKDSISGIIGLAGTHKGVLAIHLPHPVAKAITGSFLGMEVDEINSDVEDAVGELANMLGGSVKSILSANGRDISLSMPTTISGEKYDFQPTKDAESLILPCRCDAGLFTVELQLEK